jgi:hypothetical protein
MNSGTVPVSEENKMITAKFSNGHTDTYKGSRPVTAAWMVTEIATGRIIASGHSLTMDNADKTARGSIPLAQQLPSGWSYLKNTVSMYQYAKKRGYKDPSEMASDYKKQNAERAKQYRVETVAL